MTPSKLKDHHIYHNFTESYSRIDVCSETCDVCSSNVINLNVFVTFLFFLPYYHTGDKFGVRIFESVVRPAMHIQASISHSAPNRGIRVPSAGYQAVSQFLTRSN